MGDLYIARRYKLGPQIGEGSFGEVFICEDIVNGNKRYAVKMEPTSAKYSQLKYENRVYKMLRGQLGVPRVQYYGKEGEYYVLILQLLGDDLEKSLQRENRKKLPISRVAELGVELIQRLQDMHQKGLLHRDIKPQNLLQGLLPEQDPIGLYIVDFGLSKRFITKTKTGKISHAAYRDDKSLTGTPRYASVHCQMGIEQSRRDDLESAMYVLIYLAKGRLPWQGLRGTTKKDKNLKILRCKQRTSVRALCEGLPQSFQNIVYDVRELAYEERPKYEEYIQTLSTLNASVITEK